MFSLFKKKKITINSLIIPNLGWSNVDNTNQVQAFVDADQTTVLMKNFFDMQPDLPTIKDVDFLRTFYRNQISENGGALIEVNIQELKGFTAVKTIFKFPIDPKGMVYVASFTIPFENYSYVVKIQAAEVGMTGMRDAVILDRFMGTGEVSIGGEDNVLQNWFSDPYDATVVSPVLRNRSDDEEYDAEFPDHPLSRARKVMAIVEKEIEFGKELHKIASFQK